MAQEKEKRRIVLTSLLKPVDDVRMTAKMARSIQASGRYEVTVIGYPSVGGAEGIRIIMLPAFNRVSMSRWLARWQALGAMVKARPHIVIVGTHELLLAAIVCKVIFGTHVVYDVRENYKLNILHTDSWPRILRGVMATLVRLKENLLAPAIDHFFLAEKCYERQLKFYRSEWTVLENKALSAGTHPAPSHDYIQLVFTGTLDETTGVFDALLHARTWHAMEPRIRLHIIGYATRPQTAQRLRQEANENWITLTGIEKLVPHEQIHSAINQADVGLAMYPDLPHIRDKRPTKVFEYLAAGLSVVITPSWTHLKELSPISFIVADDNDSNMVHQLRLRHGERHVVADTHWDSEVPKLLQALRNHEDRV